jgi:hypothetical protein
MITTGWQGHMAHLLWDTKSLYTNWGEQLILDWGFYWNCILGCKFVFQSHFHFICIHVLDVESEVTVFGLMSRGHTAAADVGCGLCLLHSINIHGDGVTGGGVGMGKVGKGRPVKD